MPALEYDLDNLELEESKKVAITTTEEPLLIIAGPGSGKTMTLVERIVYLIAVKGIPSESIMISTFTEKAAKELLTRVSKRVLELGLDANLHEMYIGTLHSIFLRFLEENREFTRLKKNYRMLDDFDQKYFVYRRIDEFRQIDNIEQITGVANSNWDKAEKLLKHLNKASEEVLDVDQLLASPDLAVKALGEACYLSAPNQRGEFFGSYLTPLHQAIFAMSNM